MGHYVDTWEMEVTSSWSEAEKLLKQGWEPFAVHGSRVYLRRLTGKAVKVSDD